jgi:diaminopropionate ammonia-lyase
MVWHAHDRDPAWTCSAPDPAVLAFHRSLPDYTPTPLRDLPEVARDLGVRRVVAKDESSRLGLPAFKALGASYAVHRALLARAATGADGIATLVTATDGNHGRAVARFARMRGQRARIWVPRGVHPTAIEAIRGEGAEVIELTGDYDDAVAAAASAASWEPDTLLIQDMAWPGYEVIPGWIVEGYATLAAEIDAQLEESGEGRPNLVVIPAGVGSLAQGIVAHYRSGSGSGTRLVTVEPTTAACVLASLAAGEPMSVQTGETIMTGLNCGTVSAAAWPFLRGGLDGALAVTDAAAAAGMRDLALAGVPAGPCGGAGVAALRAMLAGEAGAEIRDHLGVGPDSVVVILVTEGAEANPSGV